MKNWKKIKPVLWTILGYGALGSALILGDQIHKIYKKLDKATSRDVLSIEKIQPTYIYVEDPFVQEEIEAGVSLSNERLKLTRFHQWIYDKIEASFIFRNLYSYKKTLHWKYLRLAQDGNPSYRLRAVRSLASLKGLTDAEYQQLAQVCDFNTAVGLARSGCNTKFLLDPPHFKLKAHWKEIVTNFRKFFMILDSNSSHPCLQTYISKIIADVLHVEGKIFEEELIFNFDSDDFISLCLEALLHHSGTDKNAKQIIDFGGLPLLVEVYKYFKQSDFENLDALIALTNIISNLSICSEAVQKFFASGWIKLLAILSQHKDIRVSAPAQKALINFDKDDPEHSGLKFDRRIFPLHPNQRTSAKPKVDVIFIHGLLGEVFVTWRQRDSGHCSHKSPLELLGLTKDEIDEKLVSYSTSGPLDQKFFVDVFDLNHWEKIADTYEFVLSDLPIDENTDSNGPFYGSLRKPDCTDSTISKCWPKDWLAEDCPDIRLIGINYETNISRWIPICPVSPSSGTLAEKSKILMQTLVSAGVGKRPIIWVGHSMGGLLVKGVLSLASKDPTRRSLLDQTKGIVFYSTPHKGSQLAALNTTSQMIVWPSDEVQELRKDTPLLLKLHEDFLNIVKMHPMKVITFAERESTYITSLKFEIRFVDSVSAETDVGELYGIPLDHLCICKPAGRQSFLYQKVKNFIQEIMVEVEKDSRRKLQR